MATPVLTPLDELELLQARLAEVERWNATSVRDVALRSLHERVTSLGREMRSTGFLEAALAYAAVMRAETSEPI